MATRRKSVKEKPDTTGGFYGVDPRDLSEEEKTFMKFQADHGSLGELATRQGREAEYEEALKPVFNSVLGLVQIVTKGDPEKVRKLTQNPGQFFDKLMEDEHGLLRGFLLARAMHEVVSRPSSKDPLEWAKFVMDLMATSKADVQMPIKTKGGDVHLGPKRAPETVTDQILSGLDYPGTGTETKERTG